MTMPPPGQYPGQPWPGPPQNVPPTPQHPQHPPMQYPQPPRRKRSMLPALLAAAVLVVLAAIGVGIWLSTGDDAPAENAAASSTAAEGTSVGTSPVGSCVTVSGTTSDTRTNAVACGDTTGISFIVGAKAADDRVCEQAGYRYFVSESSPAGGQVMCLIPNYRVGECYEEPSTAIGIDLRVTPCTRESTSTTSRYRITERVDSTHVPNCARRGVDKVIAFDIQTDPVRGFGVCARILGDYTWG